MLDLVKWSFTLPMIAIMLALGARLVANAFQFFFKKTSHRSPELQSREVFTRHSCGEITRLRARTHAH